MPGTGLLKRYARSEPDRCYGRYGYAQVAIYDRPGAPLPVAVFPFHYESRPKRSQSRITLNCFRYELEWLPDLYGPPVHAGHLRLRELSRRRAA